MVLDEILTSIFLSELPLHARDGVGDESRLRCHFELPSVCSLNDAGPDRVDVWRSSSLRDNCSKERDTLRVVLDNRYYLGG